MERAFDGKSPAGCRSSLRRQAQVTRQIAQAIILVNAPHTHHELRCLVESSETVPLSASPRAGVRLQQRFPDGLRHGAWRVVGTVPVVGIARYAMDGDSGCTHHVVCSRVLERPGRGNGRQGRVNGRPWNAVACQEPNK